LLGEQQMKLQEILVVGSADSVTNVQILTQHIQKKQHIRDNMYTITVDTQTFYCLIEQDIIVAFLAGESFSNKDISRGFVVKEVYVDPQHQRKGYASTLYNYVFKTIRHTIISDKEMTNAGIALWKRLVKQYGLSVQVYNTSTGELLNYNDVHSKEIFVTNPTDNKYRLILKEQTDPLYEQLGIVEGSNILNGRFHYPVDPNLGWI
jgi:GNAT superfamily N-acetyltransferase